MRTSASLERRGIRQMSCRGMWGLPFAGAVFFSLTLVGQALANPSLPSIPSRSTNVVSFGAVGDGTTDDTTPIQNAINAINAAGGGTVEIPAGTYLSNPLTLVSSMNLQIDSGAMLKMLPMAQFTSTDHFILAINVSDVEISGSGTIDGNGADWWQAFAGNNNLARPYMVYFAGGCHRVLIQDITLQNPPKMHIVFKGADDNITIQRILINTTTTSPYPAKNTDGIDLVGASCLVQNCTINAGDDNIALGSSSSSAVTSDVLITNCTFGVGHGVSIGSNTHGGVSNLVVTACSYSGTDYGIRMKSDRDRGGVVQNLQYLNLTMANVGYPIVIYSYYDSYGTPDNISPSIAAADPSQTVTNTTPIWRNITISNLTVTSTTGANIAGLIWGLPEMLVSNVTLCDVNISAPALTFEMYNAQAVRIIDSNLTAPSTANTLTLYNAQVTVTNSAFNTNLVTLGGLAAPPTNNTLAFFNARAAITETAVLGAAPITLGGSTLTLTPSSVSFSNDLYVGANPAPNVASTLAVTAGNNSFSGRLSGPGPLTLNLPTSTTLTLQGDCSGFTGTLTVTNGGTLRFNQGSSTWGGTNIAFDAGASGIINNHSAGNVTIYFGALSGGAGSRLRGSDQAGPAVDTYVIGSLNSNTTFAGTVANGTSGGTPHTVAITKIGSGTFMLSGNNSYSGDTTVSNGTFLVNNTAGEGTGSGAVTVVDGATLGGSGIIGGPVTVNGTLAPGAGVGTVAISNSLTINGGAVLQYALGMSSDRTVVSGNLTLDGTLNVTDAGGFTNGTYTLFRYGGTLTTNGTASILTIGTTPDPSLGYTVDISSNGYVNLIVGAVTPPMAGFTGSPTNGVVPLAVAFTDNSSGTVTDRFWDFGDGATSNTTLGSLSHTYTSVGSYDVSLTVIGPLGTDTLSQAGYIRVTHPLPVINGGLSVTNAALQIGNVAVVVAGDTNVFTVGATDTNGFLLSYQWLFGDGTTNDWSSTNTAEHAYTTNCGPYNASVTISNGETMVTSNFTIVVACQLNNFKVRPKLNFAKTNADSCAVKGAFDLPADYSFTNKLATLDIGGAEVSFTLPSKGSARNGRSTFSKPKYSKKTGLWTFKATLKNGSWRTPWADYSMINSNILKPGALVSDLPVILLLDTEAFMGTTNLHYTAKQGKSGTAK